MKEKFEAALVEALEAAEPVEGKIGELPQDRIGCDARGPDHGAARNAVAFRGDDVLLVDLLDRDPVVDLDAACSELAMGPLVKMLRKNAENARGAFHHGERAVLPPEIPVHDGGLANERLQFSDHLDAGDIAADDHEVEQPSTLVGILGRIGQFQQLDGPIANRDGIRHVLHLEGVLPNARDDVLGEDARDAAQGDDEVVVSEGPVMIVADEPVPDRRGVHVDPLDLRHEEFALSREIADRHRAVARLDGAGSGLDQQRIEDEEVVAIDDDHFELALAGELLQGLGKVGTTEPPTQDDDPRGIRISHLAIRSPRSSGRRTDLREDPAAGAGS